MAALTITQSADKTVLNISNMENGSGEDWKWADNFDANMGLHSIQFIPGSTGTDKAILRVDSDSGPEIFHVECADVVDQRPLDFYGELKNLWLEVDDGTYSAGCMVIIIATARKMGPRH